MGFSEQSANRGRDERDAIALKLIRNMSWPGTSDWLKHQVSAYQEVNISQWIRSRQFAQCESENPHWFFKLISDFYDIDCRNRNVPNSQGKFWECPQFSSQRSGNQTEKTDFEIKQ